MKEKIIGVIFITTTIFTAAIATVTTTQQTAYAQGLASYDEVSSNEEQQAFIAQVLNRLQNKTAEPRMSIWEDGDLFITWTDTIHRRCMER